MKCNKCVYYKQTCGQNHCRFSYGDEGHHTSFDFVNDYFQCGMILKSFAIVNYFKNDETVVIELNEKPDKAVEKVYIIQNAIDSCK